MQFETQRLIIRNWQPDQDARHAMDIYGDPRVMAWIEGDSPDTSIRQVQIRLQRYQEQIKPPTEPLSQVQIQPPASILPSPRGWAIEQKDIGRVIGSMVLVRLPDIGHIRTPEGTQTHYPDGISTDFVEIGWRFRPASWGFGYAAEAAFPIARFALEALALPELLAVIDPRNYRSIALAQRLGMRDDGVTTRYYRGKALQLYRLRQAEMIAAQQRWQVARSGLASENSQEQTLIQP